jgi:glycosyltransferase involved in cell wall biosynthesis
MGLFPIHKQLADARFSLARWLYRAPWDHVVATEEGSGSQAYLPRLLAPGTRLSVWLNGVDLTPPEAEAVVRTKRAHGLDQRPIVLWLGRLESYKGCAEFVEAMVTLFSRRPGLGKAVVIGGGSMETELRAQVAEAGRETDILLVGAVAHPEVAAWLAAAEVYVSLNRNGNLSNANLEAMRAGCAMVWLGADPETHTDVETLRLVPEEIVPRVRRWRMVEDTVEIVEALLDDEGRRRSHKAAVRGLADRLLCDWDTRIGRELDLIKGVTPAGGQAFEYQGSGGQRVCT